MPSQAVEAAEQALAEARAAEEENVAATSALADPHATPILDALKRKPAGESPHDFKERLSAVTAELEAAGALVSGDLLTAAEEPKVIAVLVKLVGELAKSAGA